MRKRRWRRACFGVALGLLSCATTGSEQEDLQARCLKGNRWACMSHGVDLQNKHDLVGAVTYFRKACDLKESLDVCNWYVELAMKQAKSPEQRMEVFRYGDAVLRDHQIADQGRADRAGHAHMMATDITPHHTG